MPDGSILGSHPSPDGGATVVPSVRLGILFPPQLPSNNHVLCGYGDSVGVNGTKVGVLVHPDKKVHLRCFLEGQDRHQVKPDVGLDLLGNLPNKSVTLPVKQRLQHLPNGAVVPVFTENISRIGDTRDVMEAN